MTSRLPVVTRETTLERRHVGDPCEAYERLMHRYGAQGTYLLESAAGPHDDTRRSFVGFEKVLTIEVYDRLVEIRADHTLADTIHRALACPQLDTVARRTGDSYVLHTYADLWPFLRLAQGVFDAEGSADSFRFGFLATIEYDAVRYVEHLPQRLPRDSSVPEIALAVFAGLLIFDHGREAHDEDDGVTLLTHGSRVWDAPTVDEVRATLSAETSPRSSSEPGVVRSWDDTEHDVFVDRAERCLEHVAAGDIYQVQIGHEIGVATDAEPLDMYRRLRGRNPSPYCYLADVGGRTAIGASPELFVRAERGRVTMRPIAGTSPVPGNADILARQRIGTELRNDPKEIAEHIMLVDLCRNDIGRISEAGSLDVPDLMSVERYSHVMHLVSTVSGRQRQDVDTWDVIRATFPAGTMTGAPKLRAMQLIEDTESTRRGLYAGALGLLDVGGYVNLALCIRTIFRTPDGRYRARASAGIVADSDLDAEWRETLAKMGACHWAMTGKEVAL